MRNATFKPVMIRLLATAAICCVAANAFALSDASMAPAAEDIRPQETPLMQAFEGAAETRPGLAENQAPAADDKSVPKSDGTDANPTQAGSTNAAADQPSAQIIRDLSTLPAPVKAMRERLVEAAASGDIERLRPLIEGTPKPPQIMNNESDDPIDTLKNFSGDPEGQEILAIMLDIMATGAARVDAGTPDEAYVWPYFIGKPLSELTAPERVELLRIVTAGDLMGMEETGNYNFYRLGISPDGQWKFMAGGD